MSNNSCSNRSYVVRVLGNKSSSTRFIARTTGRWGRDSARRFAVKLEVLTDADVVAREAARIIAADAHAAVVQRERFAMAVSGGRTPWGMLHALANESVPWEQVDIFQVDERVAPAGHADRNLTHLHESLLDHTPLRPEQIHAMPVESADLQAAAGEYGKTLQRILGFPPLLDLVHLGLGTDGHTASLVPGDPVLNIVDADVATTGIYQGRRRMTLTYPVLNRARRILWLAIGSEKREMLARLMNGDVTIPAGQVARDQALVIADFEAAGDLRDS